MPARRRRAPAPTPTPTESGGKPLPTSPWLTARQVAARWQTGVKAVYRSIRRGDLKAVRIGARAGLRVHVDWADAALEQLATPREVNRRG